MTLLQHNRNPVVLDQAAAYFSSLPQVAQSSLQQLLRCWLSQVVLQIGSTVFVHAGVLPEHARFGLERMNRSAVLLGLHCAFVCIATCIHVHGLYQLEALQEQGAAWRATRSAAYSGLMWIIFTSAATPGSG